MGKQIEGQPKVVAIGIFNVQVCVPANYTDEQAIAFAEKEVPAGTSYGWQLADEALLNGDPQRNPCKEFSSHVHIQLVV